MVNYSVLDHSKIYVSCPPPKKKYINIFCRVRFPMVWEERCILHGQIQVIDCKFKSPSPFSRIIFPKLWFFKKLQELFVSLWEWNTYSINSGAEVNQDCCLYPTLGLLFSKSTCLYGTDKIWEFVEHCRNLSEMLENSNCINLS